MIVIQGDQKNNWNLLEIPGEKQGQCKWKNKRFFVRDNDSICSTSSLCLGVVCVGAFFSVCVVWFLLLFLVFLLWFLFLFCFSFPLQCVQ